jgi:hypothetical protein
MWNIAQRELLRHEGKLPGSLPLDFPLQLETNWFVAFEHLASRDRAVARRHLHGAPRSLGDEEPVLRPEPAIGIVPLE